jgi:hypothetical protein
LKLAVKACKNSTPLNPNLSYAARPTSTPSRLHA